jgi:putative flavoprotein involved in K+ transport
MRTTTVVIGGGQAGLALSRELTGAGHAHVVLERGRIGERWRSERWDSLALLTPNWLNVLPGAQMPGDPDGFITGAEFVSELERYARSFGAPVRTGTSVLHVRRCGEGFEVETDHGLLLADNVVVATGHCDRPLIPAAADSAPSHLLQVHASAYRSPGELPPGGVIVVGAGPSGQQIALELRRAGRDVLLAAGRHARVPRRYRRRDLWTWLTALGHLDRTFDQLKHPESALRSPSLPLDGRDGGRRLDLEVLARAGVRLAGRLEGFADGRALFGDDLAANVTAAEQRMRALLERIDALPAAAGAPADTLPPVPVAGAPDSIGLACASTIVWATGYRRAYPWLEIPAALGDDGELAHTRGVTPVPGLFTLGQRWQHRMTSHQINGVGRDAAYLAARLATRPVERAA